MTDLKAALPHIALIAKSDIKKKDFDSKLHNVISSFDRRFDAWIRIGAKKYEEEDAAAVKAYETFVDESHIIAQHIYDYFVDDEDQLDEPTVNQMADQIKDSIDEPVSDPVPVDKKEPVTTVDPVTNPEPVKTATDNDPTPQTKPADNIAPETAPEIKPAPTPNPAPAASTDPEEQFSSQEEKVLAAFFKQGKIAGISKADLKEAGFDTSWWGNLQSTGQKCGKYRLFKRTSEPLYNLEKLG